MPGFNRCCLAITLCSCSLAAHAFDVDLRGEYRTGSEEYRTRAKLSNQWVNFGASLEAGAFNGKGSLDKFTSDFNEIEVWYNYKINDTLTLIPGGDWTWNNNGSTIKPFMRVNWAFMPTWRADMRIRYDHNNYDSVTSYNMPVGEVYSADNSAWQFDFWLTKFIGSQVAIEYNYVWNKKDDSQFVYNNGRNTQYLHNLKTSYMATPSIIPYMELGYLGNTADLYNNKDEWRLRFGTVFRF